MQTVIKTLIMLNDNLESLTPVRSGGCSLVAAKYDGYRVYFYGGRTILVSVTEL